MDNRKRKPSRHPLFLYLAVMLLFVTGLLLLSYFAQQRNRAQQPEDFIEAREQIVQSQRFVLE